MLPAAQMLYRHQRHFECLVSVFAAACSVMYHVSDSWDTNRLYMPELSWHRLDNVGILVLFGCVGAYLSDFASQSTTACVRYVCMFIVLLAQERAPWDVTYTFVPLVAFMLMPAVKHAYCRQVPRYDMSKLKRGGAWLAFGLIFFVLGLDDAHDPGRLFHGMWHVAVGMAGWHIWQVLPASPNPAANPYHSSRYV
jgi:predicted membrane channel-forming protein YqfA (hemolysin III family)